MAHNTRPLKILISTNYKGSWPYITIMVKAFNMKGVCCDIYDTHEHTLITDNLSHKKKPNDSWIVRMLLKTPKVKKYVKLLLQYLFFKTYKGRYDIHTIHYIQPVYSYFPKTIKAFAKQTVLVAWGSDIYRTKPEGIKKIETIANNSDYLVATKPMQAFLQNKINTNICYILEKLFVVSDSIDKLAALCEREDDQESKIKLGLPSDSFILTFGYNASTKQQHQLFLDFLTRQKQQLPKNTYILLPMTYREDQSGYINKIKSFLELHNIKGKVFDRFLTTEDNLRIRKVTDIAINLQKTDALSSSIREHLFCNKPVIVGDWLSYNTFRELGLCYYETDIQSLNKKTLDTIKNYEAVLFECSNNRSIIKENFSLDKNIDKWIDFYELITKDVIDN